MSSTSGKRNRLLRIEKPSGAVDAANQPIPDDWVLHKEKWGEPKNQTGMGVIRSAEAGIGIGPTKYSWRVNFDTSITVSMRIVYQGMVFDIRGLSHDFERKEHTDIVCETGANRG